MTSMNVVNATNSGSPTTSVQVIKLVLRNDKPNPKFGYIGIDLHDGPVAGQGTHLT